MYTHTLQFNIKEKTRGAATCIFAIAVFNPFVHYLPPPTRPPRYPLHFRLNSYPICYADRKSLRKSQIDAQLIALRPRPGLIPRALALKESDVERDMEVMKGGTTCILAGLNEH